MALKALAKYGAAIYSPEGATSVVTSSASGWTKDFTVNQQNRLLYQEQQLPDIPGIYTMFVAGQSCVLIQVRLLDPINNTDPTLLRLSDQCPMCFRSLSITTSLLLQTSQALP